MKNSIFNLDTRYNNFKVKKIKLDKFSQSGLKYNSYRLEQFYKDSSQYFKIKTDPIEAFKFLEISGIDYLYSVENILKLIDVFTLNQGDIIPSDAYLKSMDDFISKQYPILDKAKKEHNFLELFDIPDNLFIKNVLTDLYERNNDKFPTISDFCNHEKIIKYNFNPEDFQDDSEGSFQLMNKADCSLSYESLKVFLKVKKDFEYSLYKVYIPCEISFQDISLISQDEKVFNDFKIWIKDLKQSGKYLITNTDSQKYIKIRFIEEKTISSICREIQDELGFLGFYFDIRSSSIPNILKQYLNSLVCYDGTALTFGKSDIQFCFSKDLKKHTLLFIEEMKGKGSIIQRKDSGFILFYDEQKVLKNDITLTEINENEISSLLFKKEPV